MLEEQHPHRQVHKWSSDGGVVFIMTIQFAKTRDHGKKDQGTEAHTGLACKKERALQVYGGVLFGILIH